MDNSLIARPYAYSGRGAIGAAIDWNALLQGLVNAGVSVYTATQQVAAAKAAAAAAQAAGTEYNLPADLRQYAGGGGVNQYMPYIIGGVALVAVLLLLKRR